MQLHGEYLSDQNKIRQELLTQFKDELDATRSELEAKYRETLKQELARMTEKNRRELGAAKKKQWVRAPFPRYTRFSLTRGIYAENLFRGIYCSVVIIRL